MMLAKVIGTMNATLKHPLLEGSKILMLQPLSENLEPKGAPFLAVDKVQAGVGATVLAVKEGGSAQIAYGSKEAPVHAAVLGIVDQVGDLSIP